MKFNKITLLLAIMIISILAVGAVSAESVDDATISADDSDLTVATADSDISEVSAVEDTADDAVGDDSVGEPKTIDINDDTYSTYFDEDGMLDTVSDYDTLVVGTLTGKDLKVNMPVNITGNSEGTKLVNSTITLTADASGTTVKGLEFILDNVPAATYPGLAVITLNEGIHDVVLEDNSIQWGTADSPAYSTAMGIEIIGGDNGVSSNIELIDNEISISGDAPYMYGIDCYSNPWNYEGGAVVDLLAQGNKITLDGSGMVEGIYLSHVTDSVVKNNIIEIESAGGNAYGVGTGNIHDVNMEGNTIVAKATAEGYNATGISLYQSDINEKLNDITVSGSTAQKIGSDAESAIYAIVDNDNYNQYFDESGNYINEAENITLADLSNKDLTFASPVNLKGAPGAKLNNVTIKLTADASGSTITGLEIVLDNVPAAADSGLAVITLNEGIQDVVLEGNSIQWVTANSPSGATAMGIKIVGGENGVSSNIQVNDNEIVISGDASTIYGIDCYSNPWDYDGAIVNLVAQENKITLNGTGFVEGIYLSRVINSEVKDNTIEIESTGGNAYGIGTDNIHDVTVGGNTIYATTTAEGKTAAGISLYQSDIIIDNNIISASGSNTYGIKADNKSAAYIVADGNKYIVVDENNYNQFFDESGNYINNAVDCIALADLSNKDLTFASPISVKGVSGAKLTNVTFTLTAEASDSVIDGLTFDYEGASNVITLNTGIENVAVINNNITFKSTGYYMAAIVAGHYYSGPATSLNISSNNINVTCDNAVYGIDIMGEWGKLVDINSIISDNNIAVQANGMAEGIYLTGVSNCMITNNNIITNIVDTGDSIGIGVDGCNNITISDNVVDATSKQAAFGIANSYNTDNTITNNNVKVDGASAIGIGLGIDTGAVIEGNTIDVTAGDDYATTPTFAVAIGTGNSGIKLANNASADINGNHINSNQNNMDLAGASSDTKVGSNYVKEYVEKEGNPDLPAAPAKTTITVQSATVTADPNGKSKTQNIAITVKDAKGNAVTGQTIQVYVNGALKTAKTNDKGVATLAVPYKAGGTTTLVASFNGATGLLGSSATGKLTVKKNAVKIAAKTKKVKKSKAKKAKVQITVKAGKTALKKKLVTITINKKTYKAKTNAKGIATFKVKLPKKAKKYKYTVKFAGDNFNNAKTFKGKLTVK